MTVVHELLRPADFAPLLERIGQSRLVLLGEASHGTHEYYTLRAQLTQRLIAEHGFSFVAVEGDWPDCERVNRSVTAVPGAHGDPQLALEEFDRWPTWMWANTEVAAFGRWLRTWNAGHPGQRPVGFHGLDVYSLWESLESVMMYVAENEPTRMDAVWRAYRCFEPYGVDPQEYAMATRFVSADCESAVIGLLSQARAHAAEDGAARFDVWQNAEIVAGAEAYYKAMVRGGRKSWNIRDTHMADTLDRLLDHYGPDSKVIVWAHNTHIGDARATDMADQEIVNLGQLARERHGTETVTLVGFGGHRGEVIAAPRWGAPHQVMSVPEARTGSLEDLLCDQLPRQALLVFDGDGPGWLHDELDHRAIGVVYEPEHDRWSNYVPTVLIERYDAFVWVEQSGGLHPLHTQPAFGEMETYPSGV